MRAEERRLPAFKSCAREPPTCVTAPAAPWLQARVLNLLASLRKPARPNSRWTSGTSPAARADERGSPVRERPERGRTVGACGIRGRLRNNPRIRILEISRGPAAMRFLHRTFVVSSSATKPITTSLSSQTPDPRSPPAPWQYSGSQIEATRRREVQLNAETRAKSSFRAYPRAH